MAKALTSPSKQSVSLAGEFYTLAQLALRDLVGTLTLGNTKSVDILVSNPRTEKLFKLEVKTKSTKSYRSSLFGHNHEWIMGEKHGTLEDPALVYCFVDLQGQDQLPRFWLVPSKDVAKYIRDEHETWRKAPHKRTLKENSMRLFRVPVDGKSPYESNWAVFDS